MAIPALVSTIAPITLSAGMGLCLVTLLLLMGLELSVAELRAVKPVPLVKALGFLFVGGPLVGVALCRALALDAHWSLGILLVASTPPTVGASVFTFAVGGEVALALTSSVASLVLAAVAMPTGFAASVALLNALGATRAERVTLELPLGEIGGSMVLLIGCAAGGMAANARLGAPTIARAKTWLKRALRLAVLVAVGSFWLTPGLSSSTFYGGPGAGRFWAAACLIHLVPAALASLTAWTHPPRTRDAIVLTVLRRNPVIMFGVAALSFNSQAAADGGLDFERAFGIVAAAATTLDWVSLPFFLGMRYARYGRVCSIKGALADDDKGGEAAADGDDADGGADGPGAECKDAAASAASDEEMGGGGAHEDGADDDDDDSAKRKRAAVVPATSTTPGTPGATAVSLEITVVAEREQEGGKGAVSI